MADPAQVYDCRDVTIPTGGSVSVQYEFKPDAIVVVLHQPPLIGLRMFLAGSKGGAGQPLLSQGPFSFPGLSENQLITFTSQEPFPVTATVTASRGYGATQQSAPVASSVLLSSDIQAQTRFENGNVNMGAVQSFLHQHVTDDIVIGVFGGHHGGGESGGIPVSVTAAGVAAAMLVGVTSNPLSTNNENTASWWRVTGVAPGSVEIIVTLFNATYDHLDIYALSFREGVRMGNVASQASVVADPPQFTIVGQEVTSRVLCGMTTTAAAVGTVVTETSGAPVLDPLHVINADGRGRIGIWERNGAGVHAFDFLATAAGYWASAVLEILPRT